ncbi:MAG: PAS domain-containing sensor histidine kinase [Desulfobacteraceae bacterium]|nr:PAS domain-containing sensor histidine kinase [Desulfobacteraceae bacterium]
MTERKVKVLLVDGDEGLHVYLKGLLAEIERVQYELDWVKESGPAIDLMVQNLHDVYLLAHNPGKRSGLAILEKAALDGCRGPAVLLACCGGCDVDEEATHSGAADVLTRGQISPQLLERSIRYSMERWQTKEELQGYIVKLQKTNLNLRETLRELQLYEEELRRQNEALEEIRETMEVERRRYLDIFEYSPDAYIVTDLHGVIRGVNRMASALLGLPVETAEGMSLSLFVHPESQEDFTSRLKGLKSLRTMRNWEVVLRSKMKKSFPAEINVTSVLPRAGEGTCLRWSVRDISERKLAEESLKESESRLRHLSARLLVAQEEERKRISREMHDSIGASLSAIKFGLESTAAGMACEGVGPFDRLIEMTKHAIEESRRIMTDLRPSMLDDLGLGATLNWFCRQYQTIYSGIAVDKQVGVGEEEIPEPLKIVIFRIVQEALNNAAKYSKAQRVKIILQSDDSGIVLSIEDNGAGFDPEEAHRKIGNRGGMGLSGMRERAELSGGSFSIRSAPGAGTAIHASWPALGQDADWQGEPRGEDAAEGEKDPENRYDD